MSKDQQNELEQQRFPLAWPEGFPRTAPNARQWSRFGDRSIADAWNALWHEMRRLQEVIETSDSWIMSSNIPRNKDGRPRSDIKLPQDPGVALYFKVSGRPAVLHCDKWIAVQDNLYAIAKHIEALRGQKRWGVGNIEQAFRGYLALPALGEAGGIQWWTVLKVPINATYEQTQASYRKLLKTCHPDLPTGDREMFDRVQKAWEMFEQNLQK